MNKFLTKIAVAFATVAMAVGVGVAVASNSKSAERVEAAATDGTECVLWTSSTGYQASTSETTSSDGAIKWKNSAGNNYSKPTRIYANNTFTIEIADSTKAASINGVIIAANDSSQSGSTTNTANATWAATGTSASVSATGSSGTVTATTSGTVTKITIKPSSQVRWNSVTVYYSASGDQSDWETTAIAISTSESISKTIYNTTDSFPALSTVTVTKTEHDNNEIADDRDTVVTSSSTLHWVYASDGNDVTLPLSNGSYSLKVWASVSGETLTSEDNEDTTKQYVAVSLTVTNEPSYVTIAYSDSTTTNMTGGNDATKVGVSAADWSVVGYKNSASNLPGLNKAGQIRLYGNASGGNYICVNTLKANRYIVKIELSTDNSTNFAVYEGDQTTSGTAVTGSSGAYTFGDDVTGFTIINTNSNTTQVYVLSIKVYYEDVQVVTPTLTISNAPAEIGIGTNTASFTLNYYNLTSNFSVSTNTSYVTASYTAASGTGETTVYLSGVAAIASTTITVSATGADSQSFTAEVKVLPIINASFGTMSWGVNTAYADSPHTVTWNSNYDFIVSAGQLYNGEGYLGTNSKTPSGASHSNSLFATVSSEYWTLKDSSIDAAMSASSLWSNAGQALYMSNFGVVHPTQLVVNATGTSTSYAATYYILASTDSGDSWTVLTNGASISTTADSMSWSGNNYVSVSTPVQFAFVTTGSAVGTLNNISIKVWGDSYATTKVLDSIYVSGTPTTSYVAGESFSLGSAKVYAHYTDSTTYPDEDVSSHVTFSEIAHGTESVTITYMNKTTSVNVTVADAGNVYKKVIFASELLDGSKVVIGTTNNNNLMGIQNEHNRASESAHAYGYYDSGDVETYSINTAEFVVGIVVENNNTYYTFKDSDNKYLYAVASSNNYLRSSSDLTDAAKWTISFGENGSLQVSTVVNYKVEEVDTDVTKYMGGSASAFGCYTNNSNYLSIYVDVANNITVFGESYMHMSDYDSDKGWCNDSEHHYYVTAKAALIAMGSDYIDELQTNSAHSAILSRYLAWASAVGDTTPFEGEGIVKSSNSIFGSFVTSETATAIVIIIATLGITSIGAIFFIRRRKSI